MWIVVLVTGIEPRPRTLNSFNVPQLTHAWKYIVWETYTIQRTFELNVKTTHKTSKTSLNLVYPTF